MGACTGNFVVMFKGIVSCSVAPVAVALGEADASVAVSPSPSVDASSEDEPEPAPKRFFNFPSAAAFINMEGGGLG